MERTCPICGQKVTRKRGNLRRLESWKKAVQRLLEKHVAKKHKMSLDAAEKGTPWISG